MMRRKWAVREPLIRETHCDVRDVGASSGSALRFRVREGKKKKKKENSRQRVVHRCLGEALLLTGSSDPWKTIGNLQWRIDLWRGLARTDCQLWPRAWVEYPEERSAIVSARRICELEIRSSDHVPPAVSRRSKTRMRSKKFSAFSAAAVIAPRLQISFKLWHRQRETSASGSELPT